MKIILLAAGKGSRFNDKKLAHKSLLKINKYSLIENILLKFKNLEKIIIIGHNRAVIKKKLIKYPKITFLENLSFKNTEMLYSLMLGLRIVEKENILITYTDILYNYNKISKIYSNSNMNYISIPILFNWKKIWSKRQDNYLEDLETLKYDRYKNLIEIGKKVNSINDVMGQYMGIIYIPKKMKEIFLKNYNHAKWKNKHLTEFLNYLIKKNVKIKCIPYYDFWYEFDQLSELKNFKNKFRNKIKYF